MYRDTYLHLIIQIHYTYKYPLLYTIRNNYKHIIIEIQQNITKNYFKNVLTELPKIVLV